MKLCLFLLLLSTAASAADAPRTIDPAKPVSVTLPIQDWQAVVSSVVDSARISARDAARINQTIAGQVQQQLAPAPARK